MGAIWFVCYRYDSIAYCSCKEEVSQFQYVELIDSEENATPTSVQVEQKWVFAISAKLSESVFEILPNLGRIIFPKTVEICDLKFRI